MAQKKKPEVTKAEERDKTLSLAEVLVKTIDAEFKGLTTQTLSGIPDCGVDEWISTGSVLLNGIAGHPGIPVGRLTTIWGKPASGKTTIVSHLMAEAQKSGGLVVFMETEHSYDRGRGARIGVNNDTVFLYQDLYLEQVFSMIHRIAKVSIDLGSPQPILIVLDSHSGTPTKAEIDAQEDEKNPEIASSSRITSRGLKLLCGSGELTNARIALVFVCQPKMDISASSSWGPTPETYIAKRPIDYHSSLIFKIRSRRELKSADGIEITVKCMKNKTGAPFKECTFEILNSTGIDETSAFMQLALEMGWLKVKGSGYYTLEESLAYPEELLGCFTDKDPRSFRRKAWKQILEGIPGFKERLITQCGAGEIREGVDDDKS